MSVSGGNLKIKNSQGTTNLSISTAGNIITDNKIGTATDQEYIDFSSSNEVNVKINDTERLSVTSSGVDITGNLSVSGSITNSDIVKLTSTQTLTNKTLSSPVIDMGSNRITSVSDPTSDQDAATKAYVDSVSQGLDVKKSCKVATVGNINLTGTQTIDGVSISADERVLVKDQSTASQNGIYLCKAGSWTRDTDFDENSDVTSGALTFIEQGTVNADAGFVLTTDGSITIGSTSLSFSQFSGAGQITAGLGLNKSANTLSVNVDDSSIEINSDSLRVKSSGITNAMLAGSIDLTSKVSNALPIANGGTGATSASGARTALGVDASGTRNTTDEIIQDTVGAMFSNNTESNITATYQDSDGTIDLAVSLPFSGLSDIDIGLSDADKFLAIDGIASGLTFLSQIPTNKLSGTITNSQLAGSIANNKLAESTISGVSLGSNLSNLTVDDSSLQLNSGTTYNGSAARTISVKNSGITNDMLSGSIANNKLSNSSISIGGISFSLGDTDSTPAFDLTDATNYPTSSLSGTITNSQLAGSIDLTSKVTGALPIANGGTGATSAYCSKNCLGVDASGTRNTTDEIIQDVVGAMFSSNTETGITATYDDTDGTIDLVVGTLNQDTTGNAATATTATNITATANNSTNETVYLTFVDEETGSQGIETDTGLTYNPSTGTITSTSYSGNINVSQISGFSSTTRYLTMVDGLTGSQTIETDSGISFNPFTNTLTATTFSGNLIGNVLGSLTGNSTTATRLQTARSIAGVSFNGTENIDIPITGLSDMLLLH